LPTGQTNREIAAALGIGVETVTTVLAHTFPRLGVRRRAEALAYAQRQRLPYAFRSRCVSLRLVPTGSSVPPSMAADAGSVARPPSVAPAVAMPHPRHSGDWRSAGAADVDAILTIIGKLLVTAAVVGSAGTGAGFGGYSAYVATTAHPYAAAMVGLEDNDADTATLSLTDAAPGASQTGCIKVRHSGSLRSSVRIYANVRGALAPYLTLTVTRGTGSSASPGSCRGFAADSTAFAGYGAGVIYSGTLADFPTNYATGLVDHGNTSREGWTTGEEHSYRFTVSLKDDNAAQGRTATARFQWEAKANERPAPPAMSTAGPSETNIGPALLGQGLERGL
jgi:hypothetical protein